MLLVALLAPGTAALLPLAQRGPAASCSARAAGRCLRRAEIYLAWNRDKMKEAERQRYRELAKQREAAEALGREVAAKAEADRLAKEDAKAQMAFIDGVDFDRPGGVMRNPTTKLTREGIEQWNRSISPLIDAEQRLSAALNDVGKPGVADDLLSSAVSDAQAAGVSASSPVMKRALGLLKAQETAAEAAKNAPVDENSWKLDAIFDGYAMPDELDL